MVAALETLASENPELVQLVDLGWSLENRPLLAVRVTAADAPEGHHRVLGAHHGDEPASGELTLLAARTLVEGQTSDPDIAALLSRDAVWFLPHLNPDGIDDVRRTNARGVDLNRNYDYEWSDSSYQGGEAAFSEPESRALRAWASWVPFSTGLSLHAGAANIGWVWNYTKDRSPDESLLSELADVYADSCSQPGFWTTNGADWYITHGDSTDWSYGRHGTLDYTLELSQDKSPTEEELADTLVAHLPGLVQFLVAPARVRVQVVDAETGHGMPAQVRDSADGWPGWSGPVGTWSRPLPDAGSVTLVAEAPGYASAELEVEADSARATLALTRETVVALRPEPALLSRSGEGRFHLSEDVTTVALSRPGEASVVLDTDAGDWLAPLDELAPGPWTLETNVGVAPRALFVGELDSDVEIEDTNVSGTTTIELHGTGFGRGSQGWLLSGEARLPLPVEVLAETDEAVTLGLENLEELEAPIDLWLVSGGHHLAVLDLEGAQVIDTGAPEDTGTLDSGDGQTDTGGEKAPATTPGDPPRGCGCTASIRPGYPGLLAVIGLLSMVLFARSRRSA